MFRRRTRLAIALGALAVSLALPATALADDDDDFRASADRASVVQGVSAAVGVRITAEDDEVDHKCYAIQLPAAFAIQSVQISAAPNGSNWSADLQPGRVRLRSTSGNSEIDEGDLLSATITLRGTAPGTYSWTIGGYGNDSCSGGPDEQRSIPMSITPAAPTPTPIPTPAPTPQPTPASTPKPPRPTPAPISPGQPEAPTPHPSSTPPQSAFAQEQGASSGSPSPSPSGTDPVAPANGGPSGPRPPMRGQSLGLLEFEDATPVGTAATASVDGGAATLTVSVSDEGPEGAEMQSRIASSVFSAMAMLDNAFEWFVPGLTVGVPGMLILVVLGAQVLGGFVWLPAIRRTLREERRRRRPLRPAWL